MDHCSGTRRLLLLVEPEADRNYVAGWLTNRGMRTWWANDVSHAIEELSDFTVKNRPDVVMPEVSPIGECLQELRTNPCGMFGSTAVTVLAMADPKRYRGPDQPCLATNFRQLETLIDQEAIRLAAH